MNQRGFTLLEIILIIVLFAVASALVARQFGSIFGWKQQGEVRKLLATVNFLSEEAEGRGNGYRLIIDLSRESYYVLRETVDEERSVRQVDYLANLRTKKEQERRAVEEREQLLSLEEEFEREDSRQSGSLETLFFEHIFADPYGGVRLARPLEFPELAQTKTFSDGIDLYELKTPRETIEEGEGFIRFPAGGSPEFASLKLRANDQVFTLILNPATGRMQVVSGDVDFEWNESNAS
ncbi:MAG: prepilin-type N-terminal cleavage/methylation domain-containing protein [Bdellovibrionales bacterium]|nr:prepilin-type N-terminal cleavage/methylation domain-containing protein [Bdellovibrionales bacterium]